MTAIAMRITSTPMAPYINVLKSMSRRDARIVVEFLQEQMREEKVSHRRCNTRVASPEVEFLQNLGLAEFSQRELASDSKLASIVEDRRKRP